ncbi:MAG: hypothetical protein RBS19_06970 [Bacteroidales bacterium]|nr:hypothetical protein [Bacteroidales bacterium]MDY0216678.1 hypothetical protein [Bacteroidales bacterium]
MKGFSVWIFIFIGFSVQVFSQEILIEGNYWDKNLYIYNPNPIQNSCIKSITINNVIVDSVFNSNSVIVNLKKFGFQTGDNLLLIIQHDENCEPIISNLDAVKQSSELFLESFKYVRRQGVLQWDVSELDSGKVFEIEQYLWGKWITASVLGLSDTISIDKYTPTLSSNLNLFRIKQIDPNQNIVTYTKSVKVRTGNRNIIIQKGKIREKIVFSDKTHYEIYSIDGFLLLSGTGKEVDLKNLEKGDYWINYDINTEVFRKR